MKETRHIDLGPWVVAVESDLPAVHRGLSQNFEKRYSTCPPKPSQKVLTCRIVKDASRYHTAANSLAFDGPEIEASRDINIRYAFHTSKTWLKVTETAIIELDSRTPTECLVLLHPNAVASYEGSSAPVKNRYVACSEAFLYPLLVEWIRDFDACLVHCGAVVVHGKTIFLNGPPGSGKSTHVLRMLERGASFVADDLAILHSRPEGLRLLQFREVANVHAQTLEVFPELSYLKDAPLRGDGKYCISIPKRFPQANMTDAKPGIMLRLHPGDTPTIQRVPPENTLDRIHSMAWFHSRPAATRAHFDLLTDWLFQCRQWYVSRAYMRDRLDEMLAHLASGEDLESAS